MQDLVLDALSSGKLIVTRDDPRIDSSFNGNPLHFSAPTGAGAPWTAPSSGFSDFATTVTRVLVPGPDGSAGAVRSDGRRSDSRVVVDKNRAPNASEDRRYLGGRIVGQPSAPVPESGASDSVGSRFGRWSSVLPDGSISTPAGEASPQGLPGLILDHIRRQNAQAGSKASSTVSDTGAQAVPFASDDDEPTGRDNSFSGRFGNWRPGLPNSDQPAQAPSAKLPGIFTGQPMPQWNTSPPIFGFK